MLQLGQAMGRLGMDPAEKVPKQKEIVEKINKAKKQRLDDEAGMVDKARLLAVTAPHAGA